MERNLSFDTEGLENIAVHLGWAQLEMFADEVDKVQVMAAGDDSSVQIQNQNRIYLNLVILNY